VRVPRIFVSIVDDDAGSRGATASLVRSIGYTVETFGGAKEFLASPAGSTTACLVTDVHMPLMGGLELLRRFHALRPDCPVIVVTGLPTRAVEKASIDGSARGFFAKPLGAEFLSCVQAQVKP
jgi:FixJ family two-component response regulator